jgi:ankyrin repeat protein
LLVEKGVDINIEDNIGETGLHGAAAGSNEAVVNDCYPIGERMSKQTQYA